MTEDFISCCECAVKAPDTELESCPFLSSLGWRVLRKDTPDGVYAVEWRCKSCWKKFKAAARTHAPPNDNAAAQTSPSRKGSSSPGR